MTAPGIKTISERFLDSVIRINSLILLIPLLTIIGNWIVISVYIFIIFLFFISSSMIRSEWDFKVPFFFNWVFLLFWGIYVVTKSPNLNEGISYYYGTILTPFLIFFLINNIKTEEKFFEKFFNLLIVSGAVLGSYSIFIFADSGFNLTLRIPSLWYDYNIVSLFMLITFMFNLSFLINKHKRKRIFPLVLSLLLILFGIILTQTRGVWLSMLFAMIIFLLRRPKIIFPAIFVFALFSIFFSQVFEDRFLSVRYFGSDQSSLGRLQAWLASIELIKSNFLFGLGFNSFIYLRDQVFAFYFVEVFHSHNTYLRTILEMGFIGFVSYFSFLIIALFFVYSKRLSEHTSYKKFIDGYKLSFLSFIPAFMFEPYLSLYGCSAIVIWILVAIIFKMHSDL